MIIYNVTVNIDDEAHDEWLIWMRESHIPDVMRCGLFTDARISKMLVEDEEGTTYSVQYVANSMENYERYRDEFAPELQAEYREKFEGKFVAFRSLMEVVDQFKFG